MKYVNVFHRNGKRINMLETVHGKKYTISLVWGDKYQFNI